MPYNKFKLLEVIEKFNLVYTEENLFIQAKPLKISETWQKVLETGMELALPFGSEDARKSGIVYPILMDLRERNNKEVMVYAGLSLNADSKLGLNGECDFILAMTKNTKIIAPPIFTMVEAERHDFELGQGQCAAQMVGAKLYNEKHKSAEKVIYGCVTTGLGWQFMKLDKQNIVLDTQTYTLEKIDQIVGIFQYIVDSQ
jgi:hypothetical protein